MNYHFPKKERLKRHKAIGTLFQKGKRWRGRFVILYYVRQAEVSVGNHQVLFSVPKSRLRKAVDRNKIKRRLREAYRKHRSLMPPSFFSLGYVYVHRRLIPYHALAEEVKASMNFLKLAASKGRDAG
ncbi:MAG: ribonuclease P protein component [Bacteroidota bacterium]